MKNMTPADVRARVRSDLKQGKLVAVAGWRESSHDEFTRSLPADRVVFMGMSPPPSSANFTLLTTAVTGSSRGRISKGRQVAPRLLEASEIKKILMECKDLLKPVPVASSQQAQAQGAPTANLPDQILDFLTQPDKELTAMEQFTKAFMAAADPQGFVGRQVVGKLIAEHQVGDVKDLIRQGWVVGDVRPGKQRIGRYKAGPKMLEVNEKTEVLPENSLQRAQFLIGKEPALLEGKNRLEEQLAQINAKLTQIAQAKEIFAKLDDVMK